MTSHSITHLTQELQDTHIQYTQRHTHKHSLGTTVLLIASSMSKLRLWYTNTSDVRKWPTNCNVFSCTLDLPLGNESCHSLNLACIIHTGTILPVCSFHSGSHEWPTRSIRTCRTRRCGSCSCLSKYYEKGKQLTLVGYKLQCYSSTHLVPFFSPEIPGKIHPPRTVPVPALHPLPLPWGP